MRLPRAVRLASYYFNYLVNYLLAGGFLIATIFLLLFLHQIISQTRASYPPLPPVSGNPLTKPIFLRSVPVRAPASFGGAVLSVSPDGGRIAYWEGSEKAEETGLFVARVDDELDSLVWPLVTWQAWSPDSTKLLLRARRDDLGARGIAIATLDDAGGLAGEGDSPISPLDWVTLPPDESAVNSSTLVSTANWSPDGKTVLFVQPKVKDRASELWRLDLESRQSQRLAVLPKEPDKSNNFVRNLSVAPDGKKVAFINADGASTERSATWWIMNIDGSSPLPLMRNGQDTGFVRNWVWSFGSRQLVYDVRTGSDTSYQPTTLWIMNSDGTAKRQISGSDNVDGFTLSPKGNWAIYGKDSHLWLANLESGQEQQVTFGDDNESKPMWIASGDVLYHLRVGSITTLQLLVHGELAEIPGLGAPAAIKNP